LLAVFPPGTWPLQGGGSPNALSGGKEVCRDVYGMARFLQFIFLNVVERTNAMSQKQLKQANKNKQVMPGLPAHLWRS